MESHRWPSECRNKYHGGSVASGIVFLFLTTWDLGPRQHLFGNSSALNKFSQPTIKKERKKEKKKEKKKKRKKKKHPKKNTQEKSFN